MARKKKKQAIARSDSIPPVVLGPGVSGATLRKYEEDIETQWIEVPSRKAENFHRYTTTELRQLSRALGGGHRLLGVSTQYRAQPFSTEPVIEAGWAISAPLGCFIDGAGQLQVATHCTLIDGACTTLVHKKSAGLWTDLRGHRWNIKVPAGLEGVNYLSWSTKISGVTRIVSAFRNVRKFMEDATRVERPSYHQKGFRLYDLACSWVTCEATKQDMSTLLVDVGIPGYWLLEDDDSIDQLWPRDPSITVHNEGGQPETFTVNRQTIKEFCQKLTDHRSAEPPTLESVLNVATAAQRDIVEKTLAALGISNLNVGTIARLYEISVRSAVPSQPSGKADLSDIPPLATISEADAIEDIPKAGLKHGTSAFHSGTPAVDFKNTIAMSFDAEFRAFLDEDFFETVEEDDSWMSTVPQIETIYLEGRETVSVISRKLQRNGALCIPRIAPGLSLDLQRTPYDTACRQLLSDLAQATPFKLYLTSTTVSVPERFDITGGQGIAPANLRSTAAGCYAELFTDVHVEHHQATSGQSIVSYGVTVEDESYRGWEPFVNALLLRESITGMEPTKFPKSVKSCAMRARIGSLHISIPRRFMPMPAGIRCTVDPVMAIYVETPVQFCLGIPVTYVGGVGCCVIRLNPLRIETSHPIFAHPGSQVAAGRLTQRFFHVHEASVVQLLPSVMQYEAGEPKANTSRTALFAQLLSRGLPQDSKKLDFTENAFGKNRDDNLVGYLPGDMYTQYAGSVTSKSTIIETGSIADVYTNARPRFTASKLENSDVIGKWLQLAGQVRSETTTAPAPSDQKDGLPPEEAPLPATEPSAPPGSNQKTSVPAIGHQRQSLAAAGLSIAATTFRPVSGIALPDPTAAMTLLAKSDVSGTPAEPSSPTIVAVTLPESVIDSDQPITVLIPGPDTLGRIKALELKGGDSVPSTVVESCMWIPVDQNLPFPLDTWTVTGLTEHITGFGSANFRPIKTPTAPCACEHFSIEPQNAAYEGHIDWLDGVIDKTQYGDTLYRYNGAKAELHERVIPDGLKALCLPDWRSDLQGWNFLVNVYEASDVLGFHHDDEDQIDSSCGIWTFSSGERRPWQIKRPAGNICLIDIPVQSWFGLDEPTLRAWGKHGVGAGSDRRVSITARRLLPPNAPATAGMPESFDFTTEGLDDVIANDLQTAFAGLADSIRAQITAPPAFAALAGGGAAGRGGSGLGTIQAKAPLEMMALAEYAGADPEDELYRSSRLIAAARRLGIFSAVQALHSCVECGYPHIKGICPKNPTVAMSVRRTTLGNFRSRKPRGKKGKLAVAAKM